MNNKENTPEELIKEFKDLQSEFNLMKEKYEKEIIELRQAEEKFRKGYEKYSVLNVNPDSELLFILYRFLSCNKN